VKNNAAPPGAVLIALVAVRALAYTPVSWKFYSDVFAFFFKAQIRPLQAEKYKTCMLAYLGLEIFADSAPRPSQSVEM
jgi:hypothetical protein